VTDRATPVDAPALLLFARVPVPGRVKTRLAAALSARGASDLYTAFLRDASRLYAGRPAWRSVLCGEPDPEDPRLAAIFPDPWQRRPQGSGDLGERLRRAFDEAFAARAPSAVAVGADHPTLSPRVLEQALAALGRADAAVVPAEDGGYCAIGLSARARFALGDLFHDVPWSTGGVLEATLERIRDAGLSCRRLDPFYDVDRPADLERLKRDLAARHAGDDDFPTATAECLAALEAAEGAR
jgi:rSAM/selenodomain-associated transferase 1